MSSAFEGLPKTPNLKLNKPGYDNVADIEALNENADILDEEIQGIKNTFVKSVNGKEPDAGGNVNVEEYTHPNSGVTAGTYRSVTVNAQGHVTAGSNPTLAISQGGTGATTVASARNALGLNTAVTNASVSGKTITLTKADGTTQTLTTQDTVPTDPTETLLYQKMDINSQNGDTLTLNSPITNFDELVVYSNSTGSSPYFTTENRVKVQSIVNFLNGKEAGNSDVTSLMNVEYLHLAVGGTSYSAMTKSDSSTTAFKIKADSRRIQTIIGVKY